MVNGVLGKQEVVDCGDQLVIDVMGWYFVVYDVGIQVCLVWVGGQVEVGQDDFYGFLGIDVYYVYDGVDVIEIKILVFDV